MEESKRNPGNPQQSNTKVIRSLPQSSFHTFMAMIIWLGTIHLNILLGLSFVLLFPSISSFLILALLVIAVVIPVNDRSRFGQFIAWYICKHALGYFPVTVHIEDVKAFDQGKSYVLAVEPHSIFPLGGLSLLNIAGIMPLCKTKALASTAVFYTPFLRQIGTWLGLIPATKRNFVKHLEAGYSCIIIPGGVQEITHMSHDFEVAFLKKRYGFVRVSIETGTPLVPVFCFGQTNVYNWWKPEGKLYHQIARAIRFAPLIFWGAFGLPIPYRRPIQIVVGRPIQPKKNPNPSNEEVAEIHAQFISDLQQLFLRYKEVTGCADTQLKIMELIS